MLVLLVLGRGCLSVALRDAIQRGCSQKKEKETGPMLRESLGWKTVVCGRTLPQV